MKILAIGHTMTQAACLKDVIHPNKMHLEAIRYAGYDQYWVHRGLARDMAAKAAISALSEAGYQTENIGFIVAGQSNVPDFISIDFACQVGAELKCNNVRTVNLVEGCGSSISVWLHAVSLVNSLLPGKVGLVVLAQRVSDVHQDRFSQMNAILSDGAAVAVVAPSTVDTKQPYFSYLSGGDFSDCRYVDMMRIERGGGSRPYVPEEYDSRYDKLGFEKIMDIYQFSIDELHQFLALRVDNSLKIINHVITQSGNKLNAPFLLHTLEGKQSIEHLCNRLDIPVSRSNLGLLSEIGHMGCADLLISLKLLVLKREINFGDDIIMSSISTGLKWGACLFKYELN
ncbi:3-oxoacyl-[acyl-carrier-protein] synthase III C-terminal domain-containing protein [Photorhabdus sp. SF281]|uniref:3-oxoacyl-[acyl-carrier-protein] synthase III C-terminal domain-containing protein n=1 Tax=Photorhabdus sp. SF281 TaxID=3459527 RepID=UPI004043E703